MGLKPIEVKSLLYKDFLLMMNGYDRRMEKEWNHTRHILWSVINYGGMGMKEPTQPQDIWPLAMDKEYQKRMITSMKMAAELFKDFC